MLYVNDDVKIIDLWNFIKSRISTLFIFFIFGILAAIFAVLVSRPPYEALSVVRFNTVGSKLDYLNNMFYIRKATKQFLVGASNYVIRDSAIQVCQTYSNNYISKNIVAMPSLDGQSVILKFRSPTIEGLTECIDSIPDFYLKHSTIANVSSELSRDNTLKNVMQAMVSDKAKIIIHNEIISPPRLMLRNNAAILIGGGLFGLILGLYITIIKQFSRGQLIKSP